MKEVTTYFSIPNVDDMNEDYSIEFEITGQFYGGDLEDWDSEPKFEFNADQKGEIVRLLYEAFNDDWDEAGRKSRRDYA